MLVNLNEILPQAQKQHRAVPLFNVVNLEMAQGVLRAAEALQAPVILGLPERFLPLLPLQIAADFLIPMARRASVPTVVMLDHGNTPEVCEFALKSGFSAIMYDCSQKPYQDNLREMREMSKLAHSFNASIEGELGEVYGEEGSIEGVDETTDLTKGFTSPEIAAEFVKATEIDALAIAVGNAHGLYKGKPKLDFQRITDIRNTVPIPLVLHGGSGLTDKDFQQAIQNGIAKINVFTELNIAAALCVKNQLSGEKCAIADTILPQITAVQLEAEDKIKQFSLSPCSQK